jgi:hypothetical protein
VSFRHAGDRCIGYAGDVIFEAWLKRRRTRFSEPLEQGPVAPKAHRPVTSGKYLTLYTYLESRYADRVVLTFTQIEDLLGFSLPEPARSKEDWWTLPDPAARSPRYSDSWILAHRTARPNFLALTVVFDRVS